MPCCRVWAGWRKETSRVEEFVRDFTGGGGHQVEHQVRIVYFPLSNGPFSSFLFFFFRKCARISNQYKTSPAVVCQSFSEPASQMFESLGYFYEGRLLVHEYCMYVEWFPTGSHFSASFIPEDLIRS